MWYAQDYYSVGVDITCGKDDLARTTLLIASIMVDFMIKARQRNNASPWKFGRNILNGLFVIQMEDPWISGTTNHRTKDHGSTYVKNISWFPY